MKNKKAELLAPETLKIIISLVCILILVYLLFAIYSSNSKAQELIHAKNLMSTISGMITKINIEPSFKGDIPHITPAGWIIVSYASSGAKPNQCSGQNCLCICDSVSSIWSIFKSTEERQLNECSKNGVCLIIKNLKQFDKIEIGSATNPTSINIFKDGEFIGVKKI